MFANWRDPVSDAFEHWHFTKRRTKADGKINATAHAQTNAHTQAEECVHLELKIKKVKKLTRLVET